MYICQKFTFARSFEVGKIERVELKLPNLLLSKHKNHTLAAEGVVASYQQSLMSGGDLHFILKHGKLAVLHDGVLYVHGGVTNRPPYLLLRCRRLRDPDRHAQKPLRLALNDELDAEQVARLLFDP